MSRKSEQVSERVPKTFKNSKLTYLYNTSAADQSVVGGDSGSNDEGGGDGLVQLSPGLMTTGSEITSNITAVPAASARNISQITTLADTQLSERHISTGQ